MEGNLRPIPRKGLFRRPPSALATFLAYIVIVALIFLGCNFLSIAYLGVP